MYIEFDPAESDETKTERGFDFDFVARVFLGRTVSFEDARRAYGEIRMIAIGEVDGKLYKVVYTDRARSAASISANRASRQEKRLWAW